MTTWSTLRQLLLIVLFCATDVDTRWNKQASLGVLGWRNRNDVSQSAGASHPACQQSSVKMSQNQLRICQLYPDHMASVDAGVQLATEECQFQLEWRRWNCSTPPNNSLTDTTAVSGSREAALVHASMAAGIMYSVSRACRDGRIPACGCSRRRPGGRQVRWAETTATPAAGDWQWGGCSDNTDYGYRFATSFVDARQREKNYPRHSTPLKRMLMNLHDNEAGRLAVNNYVTVACKCHGVSGSCVLKTCWRQLPDFRAVGNRLLDRYDTALLATFNRHGTSLVRQTHGDEAGSARDRRRRRRRKRKRDDGRRIPKEQLVYVDESADYCAATRGRRCIRRSGRQSRGVGAQVGRLGQADCDALCCGRGYNEFRRTTTFRCRCHFVWCCRVDCDVCRRTENVLVCK